MTKETYDPKCHDLAKHFLSDVNCDRLRFPMSLKQEQEQAVDLATHIQIAIEEWLYNIEHKSEARDVL